MKSSKWWSNINHFQIEISDNCKREFKVWKEPLSIKQSSAQFFASYWKLLIAFKQLKRKCGFDGSNTNWDHFELDRSSPIMVFIFSRHFVTIKWRLFWQRFRWQFKLTFPLFIWFLSISLILPCISPSPYLPLFLCISLCFSQVLDMRLVLDINKARFKQLL